MTAGRAHLSPAGWIVKESPLLSLSIRISPAGAVRVGRGRPTLPCRLPCLLVHFTRYGAYHWARFRAWKTEQDR